VDIRIAYYSRKGSTEGLVNKVVPRLRDRGHVVTTVPIRHRKRPGFLSAGRSSIKEEEVELENAEGDYDMSGAGMVILAGPIFAGRVNPWTRTYIKRVTGLEGKDGGVMITCASKPTDAEALVKELADLASARGLQVRARLAGSRKLVAEYDRLADGFVHQLLDLDHAEVGSPDGAETGDEGDGDGGDGGDGDDGGD